MTLLEIPYDDYYTPSAVTRCREFAANGGDVNAVDPVSGYTLLWFAAEHMNIELILVLGELGADANAKNPLNGWTPVHNAVDTDIDSVTQSQQPRDATELVDQVDFSVTKAVVSIGGSIFVTADDGTTPLELARRYDARLADKLLAIVDQK